MELTKNDAAFCPDSIDAQACSTSAVEIDLYDELITFSELSPEEQSRVADVPDEAFEQPEEDPAADADQLALSETVSTNAPVELDFTIEHTEAPAENVREEDVAVSQNQPEVSFEPKESDSATLESAVQRVDAPAENVGEKDVAVSENQPEVYVEPVAPESPMLEFARQHTETPAGEDVVEAAENRPEGSVEAVESESPILDFAHTEMPAGADNVELSGSRSRVPIEPVDPEFETLESSLDPFEPMLTHPHIETVESEPPREGLPAFADQEEIVTAELIPTPSATEMVEAVTTVPAAQAVRESGFLKPSTETSVVPLSLVAEPRAAEAVDESEFLKPSAETSDIPLSAAAGPQPSGPLSEFNLPPEVVYTGALSRGVCLACGAESGADDLFCLTCGVFIDEIASTLPSNPTCTECKQRIDADEIFCPWCGSSVTE